MSVSTLQSDDHRRLLDIVDTLRSKGLGRYVDLPEIVVCGDQSAGKSSVLEAISGMSFPVKDNLCTRFATELILRRARTVSVKTSIIPGLDRTESEKDGLMGVSFQTGDGEVDISDVVDKAKTAMGLSEGRTFSSDTLRVEILGPDQPNLTMVDLPGLFRAGNQAQGSENAPVVRQMVTRYMKKPRSIILAVVSAKSDFALQEVTELARDLDPQGMRTLGLITKPDTLDAGSDSEAAYLKLAQNKDVTFRLGWHVLRNRDYETRDFSSTQRDAEETAFFADGVWAVMDLACKGVASLRDRLSNVLKDQILQQLPSLMHDVEIGIQAGEAKISRIGGSRATLEDQRRYLVRIAEDFSVLVRFATDGTYKDAFFGSAKTVDGYGKRLRAVVQNSLSDFEESIRLQGRARIIHDGTTAEETTDPRSIDRNDFVIEVKELMRRSRGCELPGTFNPLIIGELFIEQCEPWNGLTTQARQRILEATYKTVAAIVDHITIPETTDRILQAIHRGLGNLKTDLDLKTNETLEQYTTIHPITYNHYLIDTVQKVQAVRRRKMFERTLRNFFDVHDLHDLDHDQVQPLKLLNLLDHQTEANMDDFASNSAIDYMEAYYKVALKRFIDDFSVLAVEKCLVQKLASLFTPGMVQQMDEKDVAHMAAETEHAAEQRSQCQDMLKALRESLVDLKSLDKHRRALQDTEYDTSLRLTRPEAISAPETGEKTVNDDSRDDGSSPQSPPVVSTNEEMVDDAQALSSKKRTKKQKGLSKFGSWG